MKVGATSEWVGHLAQRLYTAVLWFFETILMSIDNNYASSDCLCVLFSFYVVVRNWNLNVLLSVITNHAMPVGQDLNNTYTLKMNMLLY